MFYMNSELHKSIEKSFDTLFFIFRKSLISSEYGKLNEHSKTIFRSIFSKQNPNLGIEDIIDNMSNEDTDRAVGWLHTESYYNSEEYENSCDRYDP